MTQTSTKVPGGAGAGSNRSTLVAITAAIIGIIYGYDLGNISGALLFIPTEFHLSTFQVETVVTVVVVGSIVGVLLGGPIANAIGRKPIMIVVAFSYAAFALLSALATGLLWLDITRFLLGVTIGVSIVVAPIFVAESVPAAVRGRLVVMYQLATVAGIMIAYFIDYALAIGGLWRIMLGLAALPAIVVAFMLLPLPDTPRWYLMKGRREQAREALRQIESESEVEEEMRQFEEDLRSERGGNLLDMLRPPFLKATFFVVILGFLVQITFIILVVFAVIAWLFVWWLAPETRGRPLEAIRAYWENGGKWAA